MVTKSATRLPTPATPRLRLVGMLLMIPAMVLWLVVEAVAANVQDLSAFQIVWTRYGIHMLLLAALVLPRRGFSVFRTNRFGFHMLRSMMMLIMPASFVFGMRYNEIPDLVGVFWLAPIWVALIAYFMLKETAGPSFWILLILGVAATNWIVGSGLGALNPKDIFGLAMGLSFAAYMPMTRALSTTEFIESKLLFSAFGVFMVLTPFLPFFFRMPSLNTMLQLAVVGGMGLVVLYLIEKALTLCDAVTLAPILLVQPLVATLLRWAQGSLKLSPSAIVAVGILVGVLAVTAWIRLRPPTNPTGRQKSTTARPSAPAGLASPAKHA